MKDLRPQVMRGVGQHFAVWGLLTGAGAWVSQAESMNLARVAFGIAIVGALGSAGVALLKGTARLVGIAAYWLVSLPLLVVVGLHGLYVAGGGQLGPEEMRAVAQTHVVEAVAYLAGMASWPGAILLAGSIAALSVTFPIDDPKTRALSRSWPTAACAILLAGVLAYSGTRDYVQPLLEYARQYQTEAAKFQALLAQRRVRPIHGVASSFAGTTVLVIGESTSRRHMGLYGYWRDTTPRLEETVRDLVAFRDVISPHSHTVPALMSALTSSGSSDQAKFYEATSIDIVSLARAAGIETYWISNQNEYGIWDYPVSMIGKSADRSQFLSTTLGASFARTAPDGSMLPTVRRLLSERLPGKRLIMVHLFSSHWPYCTNHPKEFAVFSEPLGEEFFGVAPKQGLVNCYDSSIAYVDWFLSEVMDAAAMSPQPTSVLYFSDHGEAPLLGTGHESSKHSSYHVEIPLLFWANGPFREARSETWLAARSNVDKPYSTARLYHSLADLMGIQHASVETNRSVFRTSLEVESRVTMDGRIRYDEWSRGNDYRENSRVTMSRSGDIRGKVWGHRTNSIGALLEAQDVLSGIEMDVVFNSDCECFRVFHSPAPDTGLTLERMLEASKRRPDLRLWLDWKNATPENLNAAIRVLDELDRIYSIRRRALVETGSDAVFPGIESVSLAGFTHGYYLPTEPILEALSVGDSTKLRQLAGKVASVVDTGGFSAITFDWRLNGFVREQLADVVSRKGLALYSWDMGIDPSANDRALVQMRQRFEAIDLSALLVTFPSVFRM